MPRRAMVTGRNLASDTDASARAAATRALDLAAAMGLLNDAKTKHVNAKVNPALFEAAARQAGTSSPAAVINAALAALATQDDAGPFLARNWGILADLPQDVADQIEL